MRATKSHLEKAHETFKMEKEDLYIEALKYGKDNMGKAIKYSDLKKYLKENDYEYEEFALWQFFCKVFYSSNFKLRN